MRAPGSTAVTRSIEFCRFFEADHLFAADRQRPVVDPVRAREHRDVLCRNAEVQIGGTGRYEDVHFDEALDALAGHSPDDLSEVPSEPHRLIPERALRHAGSASAMRDMMRSQSP